MNAEGNNTTSSQQTSSFLHRLWRASSVPIAAVLLAALIGAILLLISGASPIQAYGALIKGSFGGLTPLGRTLEKATPLIFSGLAVGFAFKAGLFNIGAQGQLLLGALVAAWVGFGDQGLAGDRPYPAVLFWRARWLAAFMDCCQAHSKPTPAPMK